MPCLVMPAGGLARRLGGRGSPSWQFCSVVTGGFRSDQGRADSSWLASRSNIAGEELRDTAGESLAVLDGQQIVGS